VTNVNITGDTDNEDFGTLESLDDRLKTPPTMQNLGPLQVNGSYIFRGAEPKVEMINVAMPSI